MSLGEEIVFYSRPKEGFANKAKAWIKDLNANSIRHPGLKGTNSLDDIDIL